MRRSIIILLMLFVGFMFHQVWAQMTPKGEKRSRTSEAKRIASQDYLKFRNSLTKGGVGRFQAVRMDDAAVLILDTKLGNLWVFAATGSGFHILYAGKVYPGLQAGQVIDSSSLLPGKGGSLWSFEEQGR